MNIRLAPSILAADFAALGDAVGAAERGGADYIHVDVMDGHFVPNLTVGPPVVRSLKRVATVPLDVHLMIADPDRYAEAFVQAGAGMLSVHVEVLPHLNRTLAHIKELGAKAGVAVNPSTPLLMLEEVASDLDYVLVMSVNPGFGGQAFLPRSPSKIRELREMLDRVGNPAPIEVDGGIDLDTVGSVVEAGAEILVAGSSIFHAPDIVAAARALRAAADRAAALAARSIATMTFPLKSPRESAARVRVRYAETDKMGVVYYANYLVWFEVGRCEWLRATGGSYRQLEVDGTILPVLAARCDYRRPVRYDDEVEIRTRATLLSPARVRFDYDIVPVGASEPSASGSTEHCGVDLVGRPRRLPLSLRRLFA